MVGPAKNDPRRSWAWRKLRARVLARATFCHLCGGPIAPGQPVELDHRVPVKRGGPSIEANVAPAHRTCNRRKGAKSTDDWRRREAAEPTWRPRAYGSTLRSVYSKARIS